MKRLPALLLATASVCCSLVAAPATANPMTQPAAMAAIRNTLGTYSCKGGMAAHTSTFTAILHGKGMEISESDSRQITLFDVKRQRWIDEYIGADGSYSVFEGTPVKNGIDFTAVYPAGYSANLQVRFAGKNTMRTTFSSTMNGKPYVEKETCTK